MYNYIVQCTVYNVQCTIIVILNNNISRFLKAQTWYKELV